jgi:hypothetical protein
LVGPAAGRCIRQRPDLGDVMNQAILREWSKSEEKDGD